MTSKTHYVGQLQHPGGRAENVELFVDKRSNLTASEAAAGLTWVDPRYNPGDVRRYGADPTGVDDSTAAFNRATRSDYQSTGNTDLNFNQEVVVPGGQYKITGPVYVHKGQHLKGAGEGATRIDLTGTTSNTDHIFQMGVSTVGTDTGGLAPEISGMWFNGGPSAYAVIECGVNGATISDIFMTSPGIGMKITGTDIRVENAQIDQCLTGIQVGGHNNLFINVLFYIPNYAITTVSGAGTTCSDITFSNCHVYYVAYNGVTFSSTIAHHAISFNNCNFLLNTQYANFTGFVRIPGDDAENIAFNGCQFSNMKGGAVVFESGSSGNEFTFNNCMFDGNKTVASYAQSTTAYAAFVVNNRAIFNDCEFKNLLDEPLFLNGGTSITDVMVRGGIVENCSGSVIVDISTTDPIAGSQITVDNVICKDQEKQPFTIVDGGWHLACDGMILTGNGATTIVQYPSGKNSTYFVNTSSTTATVRLPRSDANANVIPKNGDKLTFIDYAQSWNTNNATFQRGDNTIDGAAADYVGNTNGQSVTFTFNAATSDWISK